MKTIRFAIAVAATAILMPGPAYGQVGIGAHMARAADAFGGSLGLGLRVQLGVPLVPVSLAVNGEYFFADCPANDCSLYGTTFDLNYALPIPLLQPWVGVGWSVRELKVAGRQTTERGLNFGVGAQFRLTGVRPFVDVRYELAPAPEKQYVMRIGLMVR